MAAILVATADRPELAAIDGNGGLAEQIELAAHRHERLQALRILLPLSRRKSAMVLKSGASRPVCHISSILRLASRSRGRLD